MIERRIRPMRSADDRVRRFLATVTAIAFLAAPAAAQSPAPAAVDLQGKLYRSAFSSGVGMLTQADVKTVPEPLRSRLSTYLRRRAAFKSRYKSAPETIEQVRSDAKRRLLERSIVSLVDGAGVEDTAARFVAEAPIAHQWQGLHEGPVAEAAFAESVLQKTPSTPLAPWLCVFIAERQRIAFETYENEKDDAGMRTAAQKYRTYAARARADADPVYGALMDDIDRLPFLYIRSGTHPRDFKLP